MDRQLEDVGGTETWIDTIDLPQSCHPVSLSIASLSVSTGVVSLYCVLHLLHVRGEQLHLQANDLL